MKKNSSITNTVPRTGVKLGNFTLIEFLDDGKHCNIGRNASFGSEMKSIIVQRRRIRLRSAADCSRIRKKPFVRLQLMAIPVLQHHKTTIQELHKFSISRNCHLSLVKYLLAEQFSSAILKAETKNRGVFCNVTGDRSI